MYNTVAMIVFHLLFFISGSHFCFIIILLSTLTIIRFTKWYQFCFVKVGHNYYNRQVLFEMFVVLFISIFPNFK